jgi:hypothetical protein
MQPIRRFIATPELDLIKENHEIVKPTKSRKGDVSKPHAKVKKEPQASTIPSQALDWYTHAHTHTLTPTDLFVLLLLYE